MRTLAVLLLILAAAPVGASPEPRQPSRLQLEPSPLLSLHMHVRLVADGEANPAPIDGIDRAADAAKAVQEALRDALRWGMLEGAMSAAGSAEEAVRLAAAMPESLSLPGREPAPLRELATAYMHALASIEAAYLDRVWPGRLDEIRRAADELNLERHEREALEHIIRSLGMEDPGIVVPVLLVHDAPEPGAFTSLGPGRRPVCIVAARGLNASLLAETILHEVIHALDFATSGRATALNELRTRLREAGVAPIEAAYRDVPHTLIFVQAAETTRRVIDPDHVPYGERRGYYARLPGISGPMRETWPRVLDGEVGRAGALARFAQECR